MRLAGGKTHWRAKCTDSQVSAGLEQAEWPAEPPERLFAGSDEGLRSPAAKAAAAAAATAAVCAPVPGSTGVQRMGLSFLSPGLVKSAIVSVPVAARLISWSLAARQVMSVASNLTSAQPALQLQPGSGSCTLLAGPLSYQTLSAHPAAASRAPSGKTLLQPLCPPDSCPMARTSCAACSVVCAAAWCPTPPAARQARPERVCGCRQGPPADQHDLVQPVQSVAHSEEPTAGCTTPAQVEPRDRGPVPNAC